MIVRPVRRFNQPEIRRALGERRPEIAPQRNGVDPVEGAIESTNRRTNSSGGTRRQKNPRREWQYVCQSMSCKTRPKEALPCKSGEGRPIVWIGDPGRLDPGAGSTGNVLRAECQVLRAVLSAACYVRC